MRNFLIFFYFSSLAGAQQQQQQQQQYVTCNTSQGTVRGRTVDLGSSSTQLYTGSADVFTGIPYSQPPVNNLRFEPPQPVSTTLFNSTTIYDATSFKPKCPQSGITDPTSEDCLYLNIYTPSTGNQSAQMAVMIMIDGTNGFQNGGCDQSQVNGIVSNLVQREIVVVTFQYRLGALGFFTTYTQTVQSNLGMLDQVEAIKWVKTNIVNFGGDPNKITVAGQDDGACAASAHTLSPMSQNLFQQAIIQSGSIYSCYNPTPTLPQNGTTTTPGYSPMYDQSSIGNAGYTQNPTTTTTTPSPSSSVASYEDPSQQLAQTLCNVTWTTANLQDIQNCLKNYTVDFFVNKQPNGPTSTWMIVRDTSFLPGSLSSLSSNRPNIPIIIGTVQDEDADYAFKLINTGQADNSDNMQNWIFDFARKNKLNTTQTQNVANIISQNYNGTGLGTGAGTGTGNVVLRDQPQNVQYTTQNPQYTYTQSPQNSGYQTSSQQIVYVNQFTGYQTSGSQNQNQQNVQYTNQNQNQNQNLQYTTTQGYPQYTQGSQNVQYTNQNQNLQYTTTQGYPQYTNQGSQNVQYTNQNSQNVQYTNQNQNLQYSAQSPQYTNQGSQNVQYTNQNQNLQYTTQSPQYTNQNTQNVQYTNQGSQNVQYTNQNPQYTSSSTSQNPGYNVQRDQPVAQTTYGSNSYTSLQTITEVATDQSVSLTTTQIQDYMQNGDHIVRVYQFTHVSDVGRNTVPNTGSTWKPVFKGQDMYFITMSETIWTTSNYTAQDRQVANQMGQQWTDFVKTGQVQNWSPTTAQSYNYNNLATQSTPQSQYGQQARQVFQDQINPICQQAQNTYAAANNLPIPYSTSSSTSSNYSNPLGTVVSRQPANVQYSDGANGQNFHISFQVQGFPFNG